MTRLSADRHLFLLIVYMGRGEEVTQEFPRGLINRTHPVNPVRFLVSVA